MRTIPNSYRYYRVTRVVLLLIAVVLVSGIAACNRSGTYQLSISSTPGGSVTIPGESVFTYDAGIVTELVATPDDGYEFQRWTGDTQDIADPNSSSTNITINGDYSITAEFGDEGGPDPSQPY
jgi:hypothetical protein